jgi:integrase
MVRPKLLTPNFNLYRRTDGYYDIRYQENGKTLQKSTGTRDPHEAERVRARFASDYRSPKRFPNPTIGELIDSYIVHRSKDVASPETFPYVFAAPKRLSGALKAETFAQSKVSQYVAARRKEKAQARYARRYKGSTVSDATVNKELRMVRAALNWAYSENLLERRPVFRIELTSGKVRDVWITKEEANRLVKAAPPHLALFILIALGTAKRRGAILSLKWENVHLTRPGHEFIDFGDDVGNKRRGTTPIAGNAKLLAALRNAKLQAVTPYVIEWHGSPIRDVKTALAWTCKRAQLPPISSHTLKHTAVTWMVQADVSFERIAKFTGTSKEIIQRVYGHHSPEFVNEAIAAVAL